VRQFPPICVARQVHFRHPTCESSSFEDGGKPGSLLAEPCAFSEVVSVSSACYDSGGFDCSKIRYRMQIGSTHNVFSQDFQGHLQQAFGTPPYGCRLSLGPNGQPSTPDRLTPQTVPSLSVPAPVPQLRLPLQGSLLSSLTPVLRRAVKSNIVGGTINCLQGQLDRSSSSIIDHHPVEDD
jgi:hypothetical protein